MSKIELIATTTFGMESVVKNEVSQLGYDILEVENGKITFEADLSAIPRANLWLRSADRLKWKIGEFKAVTFDELFEQTKALPWDDLLPKHACFPVIGKSVKSTLFSVSDCQAITKKAIVEKMKRKYHIDHFPEDGPEYKIEVALLKDKVTLSIDSSGAGLHKRGYRYLHTEAPLKETMAAGMIQLSRWEPDRPFYDPFCGSGTFAIEAALIGQNSAPGLNRSFTSQYWPIITERMWNDAIDEALSVENPDQKLSIVGSDIDKEAVKLSQSNANKAGVGDVTSFYHADFAQAEPQGEYGYAFCNPPYGERLMSERQEVERLYKQMGNVFQRKWETWSVYVFVANSNFETFYGKKASKTRKLYSGNIRCDFYQFFGPRPKRKKS